jgi:hypothetical protein
VNTQSHAVMLALARLRRHGYLPVTGLALGDLEHKAKLAGRQVHVIGEDGDPILVLGWQASEPTASTQAPKLARRTLSPTATRTLVVVHALLSDPLANRTATTTAQVLATVEVLMSRSGEAWVIPAIQHTLPSAGLIMATLGGWGAGPRMQVWDAPTQDVMMHASRRLWQHPSWSEVP